MKSISPEELTRNPFQMIGKDWLLLTAKKGDKVNTMTASWGGVGIMWGKPVAFIFIRPTRYTKEFVDAGNKLSISVLDDSHRKTLSYFGTVSGRNEDKIAKSGLKLEENDGVPYFADADIAFICEKLYSQPMDAKYMTAGWIDEKWYPSKDYHTMYVVEIEKAMIK
ncbi:flavin reductase family protein [Qiania dongpingensis]|uniref:Flavin reductase family protein n=1 Tax=Qiania dongpingensis TaxID=2763669 RepID=A0A7G9G5A9_9FIRM|nr:flavin reductase family protein [Qiania dongpingensis]QNM05991.1 flavin reductase family protein [Qiania dongpingensis]